MSEILFLSHRIPYPPDKGDKIRSYHLLRALAAEHTVHLGTFVDDAKDWDHVAAVRRLCGGEACVRPLSANAARLRSLRGILTGEPLSLAYYRDRGLRSWAADLASRRPLAGVFAFSSSMAQYAEGVPLRQGARRVLDLCDVDSDKWRQYSTARRFPMTSVYAREARLLAALESRCVAAFDASLVISEAEAAILNGIARTNLDRIKVVPNGVDTDYFDPSKQYANPFGSGLRSIVFTGAMDYHANVDGVRWFADEVLPRIRRIEPSAVFAIVGSNPTHAVTALAQRIGVIVTGRVPDVRPYLAHAEVVVAPLRLARGVQNKVLEALAMARPVVATPNAVQGIPSATAAGVVVETDASRLAQGVARLLGGGGDGTAGRRFAVQRYGWHERLAEVCALFAGPEGPGSKAMSLETVVK
jgi:sugar transferase (PEP-CTERM/EpsH1 system associated)